MGVGHSLRDRSERVRINTNNSKYPALRGGVLPVAKMERPHPVSDIGLFWRYPYYSQLHLI
jgi:hypothetical protein